MAAAGAVLAAPARRGQVYIAVAAVAWSTAGVLQRDLTIGTATQVAGRAVFAALALLAFVVVAERGGVARAFRAAGVAGLGFAVSLAVASGAFIIALNHTSVANVLFILAVAPVLAALLARFVLGEPITPRTAAALAVALAGVVLMVGAPGGGDPLGDAMALLASLGFAVGIVISRYRRDVSMAPATFLAQLLLLAAFLPFADPGSVGDDDLVTLVLLGAGQIGIGLAFLTLGARLIPAAQVALISLLEVVLGPLWVWMAIGEVPTGATLAGGAVIVAAVVVQVTGERAAEDCEPVADTGGRPLR
jgi:drug/metabolite transporter (DMT)-like permease